MNRKIIRTIERHHMLSKGDTVLVALSGGADSMALLTVLYELKEQYSLTLFAAHFNHSIRGEEAKRDEDFCVDICRKLGIKIFVGRADIPALAKQRGVGLEECGRQVRYAFFDSVAPGAKVATAHTLSDCEETFLFNLARGTSLKGLTSIPPVRGNIIRPLIDCSRGEIENYCSLKNVSFVTDSTNLQDEYTRNRIRHNTVPQLKEINPAFDSAFERCVNSLREDEDYLSSLAGEAVCCAKTVEGYIVSELICLHPSVKRRAVALIIEEVTGEKPQSHHIEALMSLLMSGGDTQVCGGISLRVSKGMLVKVGEASEDWCVEAVIGANKLPDCDMEIMFFDKNNKINIQNFNKQLLDNSLDYDKIKGQLFFTSIRQGDKIRLRGRGVTKQLRRIFSEMNIQPELRKRVPVLRDSEGVLWVSGVGVCERAAINADSENVIVISAE